MSLIMNIVQFNQRLKILNGKTENKSLHDFAIYCVLPFLKKNNLCHQQGNALIATEN